MIIFVLIAGFFQGILEGLLNLGISSGFSWLYESITRREAPFRDGYRTEYKKYIGFKAARKFCYLGGTELAYFNYRLPKTLELFGGKETVADFQFKVCDKFTVMLPPQTIPFELFHFIVLDFADHRIETVGVVRTLADCLYRLQRLGFRRSYGADRQRHTVFHHAHRQLQQTPIPSRKSESQN